MFLFACTVYFLSVSIQIAISSKPLHIVLTVIDDLGWSDVGFQGLLSTLQTSTDWQLKE